MGPSCRLESRSAEFEEESKTLFSLAQVLHYWDTHGAESNWIRRWVSDSKVPANIAVDLVSRYVPISVDSESFKIGEKSSRAACRMPLIKTPIRAWKDPAPSHITFRTGSSFESHASWVVMSSRSFYKQLARRKESRHTCFWTSVSW